MEVGSDTFPRDDVTGLAAFDHLDPVSTVSTLNLMPEPFAPSPRILTPPPPPPYALSARHTLQAAPPPAASAASRPPQLGTLRPAAIPAEALRETTEVVDVSSAEELPEAAATGGYTDWEAEDDAATRVQAPMLDRSDLPAASLQMDWDEEEPETQMRGEGGAGLSHELSGGAVDWDDEELPTRLRDDDGLGAAAIAYEQPAEPRPITGRPSPFPSARPSAAPAATSVRPGAPSPFMAPSQEVAWEGDLRGSRNPTWVWASAGVLLAAALAIGARALLGGAPTPGLVTLATSPADARVLIDGQLVAGTSSPYSASDLAAGVAHDLVVERAGYAQHRETFTLDEGESRTLPTITLRRNEPEVPAVQPIAAEAAPAEPAPAVAMPRAEPAAVASAARPAHTERRASRRAARRARARSGAGLSARKPVAQRVVVATPAPAVAATGAQGTLRVNSRPWSEVFVDGRLLGNTPQMGIPLRAGSHKVRLVNQPMGLQKSFTVRVRSGEVVTKIVNLIE